MCDAISAAAAVMSVAGALEQNRAQNAARKKSDAAMSAASEAEAARQRRYQDEALNIWQGELDQMDRPAQDELTDKKTAERQAAYDAVVPGSRDYNAEMASLGASSDAPKVIQDANAKTLSEALSQTRQQLSAKAKLQGFGDRTFSNAEMLNQGGGNVGMWGNFSKGSSGVFPLEYQAASRAGGSGFSPLGMGLSLAGMGLGIANAGGLFGTGAPPANIGAPPAGAEWAPSSLGGWEAGTSSGAGWVHPDYAAGSLGRPDPIVIRSPNATLY
ncbi:hypothetical protein [Magnetospirillum aberrantis]|uniref:Uncharacterized protein n=1 Tax=Magnetospirillum aberrantis SpK TaxID=908842 RepID=A0A7C9UXH2_9PROT|nr:hypothetical protein [Magnetospirillum aberrantis]NFV81289.1 hypothetical protein [Magnetospirillum aberrantis SpK]